jgi:hypothetical protein
MPLNQHLWSTILSYLPEQEQLKARKVINGLERNYAQRKILRAQPIKPADQIFYPDISKSTNLSFVYFSSQLEESPKNTFKFHISISPQDYESVLYKSGLNQLLQKYLVDSPAKRAINSFKYVDPKELQKIRTDEKRVYGYLLKFFQLVEKHNSLGSENHAEKFQLFKSISAWHTWLSQSLGSSFTQVNTLLESTPSELSAYKKQSLALFQEIVNSSSRVEQEVQYTLYVRVGANKENLIGLIEDISKYLTQLGVRSVLCPNSDLPLTNFVSFRQDRYQIDGRYVSIDDKDFLKLKEIARGSKIYDQLVNSFAVDLSNQKQEKRESYSPC